MPDSLDQIFLDFKKLRNRERDRRLMSLFNADRQSPRVAIERIFREYPNAPMFLATAIHGLPDSDFEPMVDLAVTVLRKDRNNQTAQEFIAHASIQALSSFTPHLRELFELQPNWTTYYAMWPWRESGTMEFEFLAARAAKGKEFWQGRHTRTAEGAALEALLETREALCLRFLAMHLAPDVLKSQSLLVGYESHGQGFRKLYNEPLFHFTFPSDYFSGVEELGGWLPMQGMDAAPDGRSDTLFGGDGTGQCRVCHRPFANLVTMEDIPFGVGITGMKRLSIEVCLPCLDTGVLFYQHDRTGLPNELEMPERETPGGEYEQVILRRAGVYLVPTPSRWRWQDWALANGRENLNRLGGPPAWIQYSDYPRCPQCAQTMKHLLQLDSDLPTESGDLWLWGSGGCCYVAWCDQCKISAIQYQCT